MTPSKQWWFGIRNPDHGDVTRLSNINTNNVVYMIFRKSVSVKDGKPFIEGLINFETKMTHAEVKKLIRASYVKSTKNICYAIHRFQQGEHVVVTPRKENNPIPGLLKASVCWGLESLSRVALYAASYIKES